MESWKWSAYLDLGRQVVAYPSTYKVITPLKPINDFPMVSSLIDYETKRWKSEVI